jgi:hypothetical protein
MQLVFDKVDFDTVGFWYSWSFIQLIFYTLIIFVSIWEERNFILFFNEYQNGKVPTLFFSFDGSQNASDYKSFLSLWIL